MHEDNENAVRQYLGENNPEAMMADGLEKALVGVMTRFGQEPIALYSWRKCIDIFVEQGCTEEEAQDHFSFNVIGAWVGDGTPAFMIDCDTLRLDGGRDNVAIMLAACEEKLRLRGEDDDVR